jgi:hypothetical protein
MNEDWCHLVEPIGIAIWELELYRIHYKSLGSKKKKKLRLVFVWNFACHMNCV